MVTIRMSVSAMGNLSVAFVISHDVSISDIMVENPWPIPAVFHEINVISR